MSWIAVGVAAGTAAAGIYGANQNASAQRDANKANKTMTREGIAEDRRQFDLSRQDDFLREEFNDERSESRRAREDEINAMLRGRFDSIRSQNINRFSPYSTAGASASNMQADLLGLNGPEAEAEAIAKIQESPGQRFVRERQEKAILRNAAAMGGLRGGNVKKALQKDAYGRASQRIDNRVSELDNLSNRGFGSAQSITNMGAGPSYVTTGVDLGVRSTRPRVAIGATGIGSRDRQEP